MVQDIQILMNIHAIPCETSSFKIKTDVPGILVNSRLKDLMELKNSTRKIGRKLTIKHTIVCIYKISTTLSI